MDIILRPGRKEDAPCIAACVLAGIGYPGWALSPSPDEDEKERDRLFGILSENLCPRTDTLYGYNNAIVAEIDGKFAGCIVSYDGAEYKSRKLATFAVIADDPNVDVDGFGNETGPGEYYLDTLAAAPEFRGQGLGPMLIKAAVAHASEIAHNTHSFDCVTLAVDETHPKVVALYEKCGFAKTDEQVCLFGEYYMKMVFRFDA